MSMVKLSIRMVFMLHNIFQFIYIFTIKQINFETLIILFCLMGVVSGFTQLGYIDIVSRALVNKAYNLRILMLTLVTATYALSMVVTNDVGLIIMVPFTITVLSSINRNDKLIKVVVLETLAANLGGMATPIGNPHNLFTFQLYEMKPTKFMMTLLPYVIVSVAVLILIVFFDKNSWNKINVNIENIANKQISKVRKYILTISYIILFVLCLCVVLEFIECYIVLAIEIVFILIYDRKVLGKINYGLLIKFTILFIIVGNLARFPWINQNLHHIVKGNEFFLSIVLSQFLSNLPVTAMLAEFTSNGYDLMLGADIGGLGTLIASMASMISLEFYGKSKDADKKKYIRVFTLYNVVMLVLMIVVRLLLQICNI